LDEDDGEDDKKEDVQAVEEEELDTVRLIFYFLSLSLLFKF